MLPAARPCHRLTLAKRRKVAEQIFALAAPGGGARLDKAIAAALVELSRTQVQRLIEDGFVEVGGRVITKPAYRLDDPVAVRVRVPPPAPSTNRPEAIPLDIVFENSDLLVINKPAGLVVHPAAGHFTGTLVNAVLAHAPDLAGVGEEQRPGIVHRLDKDTSGLIVVAKNDVAHRNLQRQFKERSVEKQYLALLDGHLPSATGRIEAAIGRDPRDRKRMAIVPESQGRPAVTEYHVQVEYAAHTLVEARLLTGRTHQLRLHFAYLHCPIVGDTVYGRRVPTLPLKRQFLHAVRLSFDLPGTGQRMTFAAPLPADLTAVLPQYPVQQFAADA
jgi:23S rRNA pseudouridine1911/1915/1917 synthase